MFHAYRIPRLEQDSYSICDPYVYIHAVVAYKGHFVKVSLIDNVTREVISASTLETNLKLIMESNYELSELGYLTGDKYAFSCLL